MTTSNIPEGLSQADIDYLVANPGQTIGGSVGGGSPTRTQAPRSVDITISQSKGLRPNITGNSADVSGDRISRPSGGLAGKLAAGDAKLRAEAAEKKAEQESYSVLTDPHRTNERISYLERQLKKAMSEINKLKKVQP